MDTFPDWYADIHDPGQHPRVIAQLRDRRLVTFSGIHDRAGLLAVARRLITIRPHRDARTDGVTVITATGDTVASGYSAFTDAELTPHTDGSSLADPPRFVMLACLQPAAEGGETCVVDGARVLGTLAARLPPRCGRSLLRNRPPSAQITATLARFARQWNLGGCGSGCGWMS